MTKKLNQIIFFFFFFDKQTRNALEKAKRHKAYREYTRRLQPQKEKKAKKNYLPSSGSYPLQETYKGERLLT